jgi:hypothetical protein
VSGPSRPSLFRRFVNSLRAWPRGTFGTLDIIPNGFVFTRRNVPVQIFWKDVTRIDAGTRDYLTVDLFYVIVHTAVEADRVLIDEMIDGFRQFEQEVFNRWPRIRPRWLALQASPLHVPQFETLWRR